MGISYKEFSIIAILACFVSNPVSAQGKNIITALSEIYFKNFYLVNTQWYIMIQTVPKSHKPYPHFDLNRWGGGFLVKVDT